MDSKPLCTAPGYKAAMSTGLPCFQGLLIVFRIKSKIPSRAEDPDDPTLPLPPADYFCASWFIYTILQA